MENLGKVLGAVNNGWALSALIVVAFYLLARKFGGDLLKIVTHTNENTTEISSKIDDLDARISVIEQTFIPGDKLVERLRKEVRDAPPDD